MAQEDGEFTLVLRQGPTPEEEEAILEQAWKKFGDLHILADRLAYGLTHGEVSPALAWVHKALLDLADTSVDIKPYAKQARTLVRHDAVYEAHYVEGLPWGDKTNARAAEMLHGWPAACSPDWMWKEYKKVRKVLRAAGRTRDDDEPE